MEAQLKSQTHITKVCGTAYSTLKNIARVQNLLTPEAAKIIIQGLVISKLDCYKPWIPDLRSCDCNK